VVRAGGGYIIPFGIGAILLFSGALATAFHPQASLTAALAIAIAALACVVICLLFGSIVRGFAFTSEGRVSVRGGWFNRIEMLRTIKEHTAIASIETIKTHRGAGIAIYTSWGGTFHVGDALGEADARLVAVQLTIALREMRESLTTIASYQSGQRRASAAYID
jgi:hypothetical protein